MSATSCCARCLDTCCGSDVDFPKNKDGAPRLKCPICCKSRSLVLVCNAVAALLHATLFASLLVIVYMQDIALERPLSQKISVWEKVDGNYTNPPLCFHSSQCAIPSPKLEVETNEGDFNIYAEQVDYGALNLVWLVLSFSLLSAVFQGLRPFMDSVERCLQPCVSCACGACCSPPPPKVLLGSTYLTQDVMRGVNSSRFVEYSLSATVMILCIAFVLNVDSFETIVALAVLTACCQLSGLVAELLLEKDAQKGYRTELFGAAWLLHGLGWLQMGATFWLVVLRFLQSAQQASDGKGAAPPEFVYAIVFGQLAFFSSFGLVQLGDFVHRTFYDKLSAQKGKMSECCGENRCCGCPSREFVELWYISLSLTSKVFLSVLIAANLFINPEA